MQDRQLYARILGVEAPWRVTDVELRLAEGEVCVHVSHGGEGLACPECGKAAPGYDTRRRRWRHLPTCQYRTILVADVPRVECPDCGVRQARVPWSEPGSGFTALFEALAIHWLREASISAVARLLGVSWDEVDGIMARAVARGLARRETRPVARLGVDETSFQRRHEYVTVVSDQRRGIVLHVADDRRKETPEAFHRSLPEEHRRAIEVVAMDAWEHREEGDVRAMWRWWCGWAARCRLEPMRKVGRMVRKHLDGIVTAILRRAKDAGAESINSRIQWIKRLACGFRNRQRFRNAIDFHLGGLDLLPATVAHTDS